MNQKITIKESVLLYNELLILIKKAMPLKTKYYLNKLFEQTTTEFTKFEEFRKSYFDNDEFAFNDEVNNQKQIKSEKQDEFLNAIEEYLSIEIEINFQNEFDLYSKVELLENENLPTFYKLLA
jgi:nitric oxide reductase activation protein